MTADPNQTQEQTAMPDPDDTPKQPAPASMPHTNPNNPPADPNQPPPPPPKPLSEGEGSVNNPPIPPA